MIFSFIEKIFGLTGADLETATYIFGLATTTLALLLYLKRNRNWGIILAFFLSELYLIYRIIDLFNEKYSWVELENWERDFKIAFFLKNNATNNFKYEPGFKAIQEILEKTPNFGAKRELCAHWSGKISATIDKDLIKFFEVESDSIREKNMKSFIFAVLKKKSLKK